MNNLVTKYTMNENDNIDNKTIYFLRIFPNPITNRVIYYIDDLDRRHVKTYEQFEDFIIANDKTKLLPEIKRALMTSSNYLINFIDDNVRLISAYNNDDLKTKMEELLCKREESYAKKDVNLFDRFFGFDTDLGIKEDGLVDTSKLNIHKKRIIK